ncbi:hypothetical protein D0859_12873 [Hortaea werneckii]|uniref:Prefoldin subunit 5 n=1 Tax=Hortaea werneckii TaxID=91943 RepID=A0A3M7IC98_HORWE|nr:hypothetical protein D0859_12873 [Hortaea werneckii]
MAEGAKGQQIDLGALSAQQLSQVKKQLDEEVQHLTNSYQNLRTAQQKFRDCITSVKNGVAESVKGMPQQSFAHDIDFDVIADRTLLVPLTSSLYVPGQLADTENVLVDVGTGFYVEKSTDDAQKFYNAKIEELGKNIKELENIVNGKANNLRVIEEVLRQKVLANQQQGGQASAGSS